MATFPRRGRIVEFAEDSGWIQVDLTRIRFGRTSCSGFEPKVGLDVYVMATKIMPVVGERATLVNLTGIAEAADPTARARQRRETEERVQREQYDAKLRRKREFYERALRCDLPRDWHPGLVALAEVIELPPALRALSTIDERAGDANAARAERERALAAEIKTDLIVARHREADALLELCVGPAVAWPIQDAGLVPFAQIDGEEPDFLAVFFHPELYRERGLLPAVYWRHEDGIQFIAEDSTAFIAALVHGRFAHEERGDRVQARADLVRATGLGDPGERVEPVGKFPPGLRKILDRDLLERRASEELAMLSYGDDYEAIEKASESLEQRYRSLGWHYHLRHTQFQRVRNFAPD